MQSFPDEMRQAAYATYRGVSRQAVFNAIERGKIPATAIRVDDAGEKWIKVADADFALGETRERIDTPAEDDAPAGELVADETPAAAIENEALVEPSATTRLTAEKASKAYYDTRIAELAYRERLGELVLAADVVEAAKVAAGKMVAVIRQLSTHAETLSSANAASGMHGLRGGLKTIEREMLTAAADAFAALAAVEREQDDGADDAQTETSE